MNPICLFNGRVMTGFSVMEKCAVLIEDGLITDVFSQKRLEQKSFGAAVKKIDVNNCIISPGFIDTHIHGFGGFGTEDVFESPAKGEEALLGMSLRLAEYGVSAFNPTLYPSEPDSLLNAVKTFADVMGKERGARIMGLHLEGPFLSPERLGVMRAETISPVDLHLMEKLWEASNGRIVNMTVAPELKGMRGLALYCMKKGIVLQAGHTNAEYDNMIEGMQAGILHATHLFNAMRRMDHRDPNAAGAILIHQEMSCEIIADGHHIHPSLYKLILREKPIDKIVLITDALKCTEQEKGPFFANGEEVEFSGGVFCRKGDNVIAGSSLTMIRGIQNLVNFGFTLEDAIKTASYNPANIMRFQNMGAIMPGKDADITVFDKDYSVKAMIIGGRLIKNEF